MSTESDRTDRLEWLPLAWRPGLSLRRQEDGLVVGRFFGAELCSVFQPIVEPRSGRRIGYEAFVRCHSGGEVALSPWSLFSWVADDDTLVGLDRLCRTLHVLNDPRESEDELLFLNVHGRLLAAVDDDHGRAFRRVLDVLGKRPGSIVIETPEVACRDPLLLAFVLANYRLNGFRVAANVGSPQDAEALFAQARPGFLKADIRHLREAEARQALAVRAWAHAVDTIFTRVAKVEDLHQLPSSPAVLAQGYACGKPLPPYELKARAASAAI